MTLRGRVIESVAWQGMDAVLIFTDQGYLKVRPEDWESDLKRRDILAAAIFTPGISKELERGFGESGAS